MRGYHLTLLRWLLSKKQKITSASKDAEKVELIHPMVEREDKLV
jgi:hypothetical protein